jgi:2-methylcitrate dehydratase
MTQVEALAKYAAHSSFADLSSESRRQLPTHILDSLGCSIAALGAGPVQACREQVAEFGGTGPNALIGGGQANPIYAAFWHTALVRYVDFMDNFLAPTETCHTADNFGVALTIADYVGGSGRDLMLGVALGYTVQSRFVDHGNFMTRGFDHTTQLAFSHNAAGRLLGLSDQQIGQAIAMAAVSDASFAVVRAKPLSQCSLRRPHIPACPNRCARVCAVGCRCRLGLRCRAFARKHPGQGPYETAWPRQGEANQGIR